MSRIMSAARFALVCSAAAYATAQVPITARPASAPGVAADPADVHIDDHCRVFAQDRDSPLALYSRPQFRHDPDYCEVEGRRNSSFMQITSEGNIVSHTRIATWQETFVLHNPIQRSVVFVVVLPVKLGWVLSADRDPTEVSNTLQTYRIPARAGQTVHLRISAHN